MWAGKGDAFLLVLLLCFGCLQCVCIVLMAE